MTKAFQDFQENKQNKYLNFIAKCREKEKRSLPEIDSSYQIHHIVPRHHFKNNDIPWETFDSPENRVRVSFKNHIKAHELRFEVYREYGDKLAFQRMKAMEEDGMKAFQQAGGQAVNKIFKKEGRLMHDPEFQKEMSKRSMARRDACQIRRKGGKIGNRKRHQNITVQKEDWILWFFQKEPFLCSFGFDNGGDLLRELFKAKETPLQRVSPLVKGTKKSLHGWSCQKIQK